MTDGDPRPGSPRDYSVFGFRVRSEFALPELFPAAGTAAPDVTIEMGFVAAAASSDEDGLGHVDGALVLTIPGIARYCIENGKRIIVEREPGVPERNMRLFLLGSAFGVLLHQRGLLPLHANAIEIEGQAIAFAGPSGAGKSTLAAWFHDCGYRIVSDDVCVIGFGPEGRPYATPGLPRLRLWSDALKLTGRNADGLSRSYIDDADEKFDVPIDAASAASSPVPLAGIYMLERGDEFSIVALDGIEAADGLFANTYRGEYLGQTMGHKGHWQSAVRLVRGTSVLRATRPWGSAAIEEHGLRLLEHARRLIREQKSGEARGAAG